MVKHTQAKSFVAILPWIIWIVGTLYFFFDYMNQVVPSVMADPLMKTFHVDATVMGTIAAVYFYVYAVMQIPVGLIVDHFGPHRSLGVAAIIATIGCILFSMSSSADTAMLTRMLVGAGACFSFVSCLKLISNWFPENRFGTMTGLTNIVGMIGAIVGVGPLSDLTISIGWRHTNLVLAAVGAVICVLIFVLVRDHPYRAVPWHKNDENNRGIRKSLIDLKHIFSNSQSWINGIYGAMINTAFTALGALWGAQYFQKLYNLSEAHAGTLSSMIFVGAIPGSFFFGWFSDKIQRRKPPMIIGACGGMIFIVMQLYVPNIPLWGSYVLMFFLGFFCSGNVVAYGLAHDIRPEGSAGVSLGFVNMCLIGGSSLFQPFIGWLLVFHASGVGKYSIQDYRFALSSIVVCLAITLITSLMIRETYCGSRTKSS